VAETASGSLGDLIFRDHRLTGLDYLGLGLGRIVTGYKSFPN
jgi:hypothetical protein